MIRVPAGQKTSRGYNTQLLSSWQFSSSSAVDLVSFTPLPSLTQTDQILYSSQLCGTTFHRHNPQVFHPLDYASTTKSILWVLRI